MRWFLILLTLVGCGIPTPAQRKTHHKNAPCSSTDDCDPGLRCSGLTKTCATTCQLANDPSSWPCGVCTFTEACIHEGYCTYQNGICVVSDVDCLGSENCRAFGQCSSDGAVCFVASDANCQESDACKMNGKCRANNGECAHHPAGGHDDCCPEQVKACALDGCAITCGINHYAHCATWAMDTKVTCACKPCECN